MPNSRHFFFNTVSPTFRLLEASTIGISKYFTRSGKVIFAMRSLAALLFFFSVKPAIMHLTFKISNSKRTAELKREEKRTEKTFSSHNIHLHGLTTSGLLTSCKHMVTRITGEKNLMIAFSYENEWNLFKS